MAEQKQGIHYGWFIFIGCCCLAAGSMAITVSIIGVYLIPASTALGVTPGDFAMWATVSGLVSFITMPFWGQIMGKHTRLCFTIGSLCLVSSILLIGFAPNLIVVIIGGCFTGASLPTLFTVGIPSLMGQWFVGKQRAKFLGICTAFSGVGTFVWAPMFTIIIQSIGVQGAYVINAIIAAVLTLPFALFVFKWSPEDMGLRPIGYVEGNEGQDTSKGTLGVSAGRAMKSPAFWLLIIALGLCSLGMGYNSNQTTIADEFLGTILGTDGAALLGATMISAAAVGNIVGKIVFGFVCDKIGVRITNNLYLVFVIIAMIIWLFVPVSAAYVIAGFLFGAVNAVSSVGFPLACREIFGNRDYAKIWSRLSMPAAFLGGFSTSIVSYIAQFSGSYANSIYAGIVIMIVVMVLFTLSLNFVGKLKFDEEETE